MTQRRMTSGYNLMGSRYDTLEIRARSTEQKHVPLTNTNQRNQIADYGRERQAQYNAGITLPERVLYRDHLTAECTLGHL